MHGPSRHQKLSIQGLTHDTLPLPINRGPLALVHFLGVHLEVGFPKKYVSAFGLVASMGQRGTRHLVVIQEVASGATVKDFFEGSRLDFDLLLD